MTGQAYGIILLRFYINFLWRMNSGYRAWML